MDTAKEFYHWFMYTSRIVGIPVMFVLITFAMSRMVFTGTCLTFGYKCRYSWGTEQIMAQYLSSLLGGEADLELKVRTNEEK